MGQVTALWNQFLAIVPLELQGIVSLGVFLLMVVVLIKLVQRNFIWIILLVLFVPASVPILTSIVDGIFYFLQEVLP